MGDVSVDSAKITKSVADVRNMFEQNIRKAKETVAVTSSGAGAINSARKSSIKEVKPK